MFTYPLINIHIHPVLSGEINVLGNDYFYCLPNDDQALSVRQKNIQLVMEFVN